MSDTFNSKLVDISNGVFTKFCFNLLSNEYSDQDGRCIMEIYGMVHLINQVTWTLLCVCTQTFFLSNLTSEPAATGVTVYKCITSRKRYMYVYNIRNPSAITLISYITIPYLEAISSCIHTCKCNYSYMLYIYIYIYIYLHTCITSELAIHTDIKDNYYRYDYRIKLFFFYGLQVHPYDCCPWG